MYVFEFKGKLPQKADKATLTWDRGINSPTRNGKLISLPFSPQDLFFPILEGRQFLYLSDGNCWFGGTDEEPFLVQMRKEARDNYIEGDGSEEAFYRGLVPETIKKIAAETRSAYRRQGDIFAARFCGNDSFLRNLEKVLLLAPSYNSLNGTSGSLKVEHGSFSLLGTRHEGRGTSITIDRKVLFTGIVKAPDHTPLSLEDGLYAIGQTQYIVDPAKAD